jgi:ribonuclease HII
VVLGTRLNVPIADSKQLSPKQRERAFKAIVEAADFGVGIVPAEEIDRLNILQATLLAMKRAVEHLPLSPDYVLIDGNQAPRWKYVTQTVVGGDRLSYLIACASIVAKVVRDHCMHFYDALYPGYGFAQHKGYGTVKHHERLSVLGPAPIHRKSFAPVAAIAPVR